MDDIIADPLAAYKEWENVTDEGGEMTERLKVEGGWLYRSTLWNEEGDTVSVALTHVPDVDLQRYQAHLRDAYNQGFKDGVEEGIITGQNRAKGHE